MLFLFEQGLLEQCHSANAAYLFQQDKFYDVSYDTGDKSIQCGRKNDVLKLWIMWKNKGDEGFERDIDNQFECAKYLAELVKRREGFELMLEVRRNSVFLVLKSKHFLHSFDKRIKRPFFIYFLHCHFTCSLNAPTCVSTTYPRDCEVWREPRHGGMKSQRLDLRSRRA